MGALQGGSARDTHRAPRPPQWVSLAASWPRPWDPYSGYSEALLISLRVSHQTGLEVSETLIVSNRGQITLPAATRKRLGIKGGDMIIMEHRGNEIVLKLGVVLEIEIYSDEQIAEWDTADQLDDAERERIVDAVTWPR